MARFALEVVNVRAPGGNRAKWKISKAYGLLAKNQKNKNKNLGLKIRRC